MTRQHEQERKKKADVLFAWIGAVFLLLVVLAVVFYPQITGDGAPSRRSQCKNNLKQIAIAFHNYHDVYGCFPPAYIADENGRPMHSWRVLILPYLDEENLFDQYNFDEPWNGPSNSKLRNHFWNVYNCPSEDHKNETLTSYLAVVGPNTTFPGSKSISLEDITDGSPNTIMVVEVENSGIHWMEPRDLRFDQMEMTINPKSGQGISSPHEGGVHVLFGDGAVRYLSNNTSPATLRRLLEINYGESLGEF